MTQFILPAHDAKRSRSSRAARGERELESKAPHHDMHAGEAIRSLRERQIQPDIHEVDEGAVGRVPDEGEGRHSEEHEGEEAVEELVGAHGHVAKSGRAEGIVQARG
jgi:hypothetical protein